MKEYSFLFSFSLLPTFLFQSVKEYLQGDRKGFLANILSFLSVFLNLGLGFLFVFGYGTLRKLALKGLGVSINIVRWVAFFGDFFPCLPLLKKEFPINRPF